MLAGFGNLQGKMEVWDVKKYKQVRFKGQGGRESSTTLLETIRSNRKSMFQVGGFRGQRSHP